MTVDRLAIRFYWLLCAVLYAAVMLCGCGGGAEAPGAPSSGTPQEEFVLSETARYASLLGKSVVGKLTDKPYEVPAGHAGCPEGHGSACEASGWYFPGTAWYYRPHIVTYELGLVSDIAAHETCHAVSPGHDPLHYACILSVGAHPTYPRP